MEKFNVSDPRPPMLLPVDLREWVPQDHLSQFVPTAVERVTMSRFRSTRAVAARHITTDVVMPALLICSYANGVFGSRCVERATYRDLDARYIAADTHPGDDTICEYRRESFEAVTESSLQALLLAHELKLVRVEGICVGGTKLDANASKHRSVRYDRTKALVEQHRADIGELLEQTERSDAVGEADTQSLPEELARGESCSLHSSTRPASGWSRRRRLALEASAASTSARWPSVRLVWASAKGNSTSPPMTALEAGNRRTSRTPTAH